MPYKDPERARLNSIERNRRWKKRHPDRVRESKRQQYKRNGAAQKRKWVAKNREKARTTFRVWAARNVAKRKASAERYKQRHGQELTKRRFEWRKNNPERDKETCAHWRSQHRKEAVERERHRVRALRNDPAKYLRHRLQMNVHRDAYYARKRAAKGSHTLNQWLFRIAFYGWRCAYCDVPLTPKTLQKDHRIPVSRGGSEWASNLVPACKHCNVSKGNRKMPVSHGVSNGLPPRRFPDRAPYDLRRTPLT